MGAGTYISSKSARKVYESVVEKLHKALHSKPAVERSHLVRYYVECGLSKAEAERVVSTLAHDHRALLMDIAAHEGKVSPDSYENAVESGIVMWVAYVIGGAVPLVFYLFMAPLEAIAWSVGGTFVMLYIVGLAKARITGEKPWESALEMLTVSAVAAGVGFVVGQVAKNLLGIST